MIVKTVWYSLTQLSNCAVNTGVEIWLWLLLACCFCYSKLFFCCLMGMSMLSVSVDIVVDAFFYFVVAVEVLSLLLTSIHLTNITSNAALIDGKSSSNLDVPEYSQFVLN